MNLPKGCIEYNPQFQDIIDQVVFNITNLYKSYGFKHLDTSIIQYLEGLNLTGEINKEIYSLARAKDDKDSSKTEYALRFDLTKPLARYVEENQFDLNFPFKRWDYGQVFRGEKPQKGRYRQFYQCDFDIIGKENLSLYYDYEVCSIVYNILYKLGIEDFTIKINNRKFINDILILLKVPQNLNKDIFILLDKFYKLELSKFKKELEILTSKEISDKIIFILNNTQNKALSELKPLFQEINLDISESEGFLELISILKFISREELSKIQFDLSIVRGLDYYTGFVFETYLNQDTKLGSIFSGGRYENLINSQGIKYPGIGGSVGISRLATYLEKTQSQESSIREGYLVNLNLQNNIILDKIKNLRDSGKIVSVVDLPFKKALKIAIKENFDKFVYLNDQNIIIEKQIT